MNMKKSGSLIRITNQ